MFFEINCPKKMKMKKQNLLLESALKYASLGFSVIPLIPRGKKPAIKSWAEYQSRFATDEELKKWFGNGSKKNIGIVTGNISGIDVLDLDSQEAIQYAKEHKFPITSSVKTGKGFHCYYKHKDGVRNFQKRDDLPGIDLRGDGGYVVAPPSIHPSGQQYQWVEGKGLDDIPCGKLPGIVLAKKPQDKKPLKQLYEGSKEGNRNNNLARLVGSWVNDGLEFEECMENALIWNDKNTPPLPKKEVEAAIRSIMNKHELELQTSLTTFNVTDLGNSQRLVIRHGDIIRYCYPWKKWLVWDKRRGIWQVDSDGRILRLAKGIIKNIYNEAAAFTDKNQRETVAKWALRSEAAQRLQAMVELAKSEEGVPVSPDELDTNQWLLNCLNGTIDLRTGIRKEHDPNDFITKIIPVEYNPEAKCPLWIDFLMKTMNQNDDLIHFLQVALGYSITGSTSEQCLFLLYGVGANGKSTFLDTISTLLGNYAQTASFDTFLVKKHNTISNGVARMQGRRFISAVEAEGERRLAEVLIKQLTGGDTITARFLFGEYFEFQPQFKLWLAANHKPTIKGTDHAIWRRIKLIPFNVTISEEEQDKMLKEKLREQLSGILTWIVQGCLEWQAKGLESPEEVKNATSDYRNEMDEVGSFLTECCIIQTNVKVNPTDLYDAYKKWCEDTGETVLSQRAFGTRLTERGLKPTQSGGQRFRCGVGLLENRTACTT
jgi:putative DNA primase/helicase